MPGINHVFLSAVVHGMLAFCIFGWPAIPPSPEPRPTDPEPTPVFDDADLVTESELVSEDAIPSLRIDTRNKSKEDLEESVAEIALSLGTTIDETSAEKVTRIDFAGAPPGEETAQNEPAAVGSTNGPGLSEMTNSDDQSTESARPAESLMTADFVDMIGLKAPPVFFTDLSVADMDRMVRVGQGAFLALFPPKDGGETGNIFVIEGSIENPVSVAVASQSQLNGLSERALRVPRKHWQRAFERLEIDYGVSSNDTASATITFAMSNVVDHYVLRRQQEAASSVSCRLEDISRTRGRLIVTERGVEDFVIVQVLLKDGRSFNVKAD